MTVYYHGGVAKLAVGDLVKPNPPHLTDGCYLCVARSQGRTVTVGEYREVVRGYGQSGEAILRLLEDQDDNVSMDPPNQRPGVYMTQSVEYATYYAALRGHGDLYEVEPIGPMEASDEYHVPSFIVGSARVAKIIRRTVWLTRKERRHLHRTWAKADKKWNQERAA